VPLFFVMNKFGVLCTFIYQFPYSLDIYVCGILSNWIYPFNWDVTTDVIKSIEVRK